MSLCKCLWLIALCSLASNLGALAAKPQCGDQAGGASCPGNLCCSKWGFCGSTSAYCSPENCQSNCPSPPPTPSPAYPPPPPPPTPGSPPQCGWQADGALCPGDLCCSQWGYCGSTPPYCGPGCQSNCPSPAPTPSPAYPPPPPPPTPGSPPQCGEQADGALCPGNLCCSKWGYCGNTPAYCGDGCQSNCPSSPLAPTSAP